MIARSQPSWKSGFAHYRAESAYPTLWDGLRTLWLPALGPTGSTLFGLSGRGNHGTLTGMDLVTDWVLGDSRIGGYALNFNGSTATVPFDQTLTFTGPFTLLMYFRLGSAGFSGFDNMIWGHGNSDYIRPNGNATLFQIRAAGPTYEFTLDDALVANTWYSLAFARNVDDLVTMYVDGVPQADTETVTETVTISRIGSKHASANFLDGQIAVAVAWDRALTASEIQQEYRDPLAKVRPKVRRWGGTTAVLAPVFAGGMTPARLVPMLMYGRSQVIFVGPDLIVVDRHELIGMSTENFILTGIDQRSKTLLGIDQITKTVIGSGRI